MSDKINDGGPAFPVCSSAGTVAWGMSLRDYYAGQALVGIGTWMPYLSGSMLESADTLTARAEWAYRQADAMLAARAKGGAQ